MTNGFCVYHGIECKGGCIDCPPKKIRAEIDRQEKWLLQAGYTAYNADIAFDAIKSVLAESEDSDKIHEGCDGCAHIDDGFDEEPCKWCRYNYEDKWEAKK